MADHEPVAAPVSGGVEPVTGQVPRAPVPAEVAAGAAALRALGDRAAECVLRHGASDPLNPYAVLVALTAEALTTVANIVGDDAAAAGQRVRDLVDLAETGDAIAWYARALPASHGVADRAGIRDRAGPAVAPQG